MNSLKLRNLIRLYLPLIILFICFLFGTIISLNSNYGYDYDIYRILKTFINIKINGVYIPSRGSGGPIGELLIGFFAWIGGSKLSNLFSFLMFIGSILIYPFVFEHKPSFNKYLLFICLCITSKVLFFDNTTSMDYSVALFFLIFGCLLKARFVNLPFASIFIALSIGTRISFVIFLIPVSFFLSDSFKNDYSQNIYQKISFLFSSFLASSFIYFPIWFISNLELDFIVTQGPENGIINFLARAIYKSLYTIGFAQISILFLFSLKFITKNNLNYQFFKTIFNKLKINFNVIIIIINLAIFIRYPFELSYLQPALISFYYLFSFSSKNLFLSFTIIFLNIFNWFINIDLLDITYKSDSICAGVNALGAKPSLVLSKGSLFNIRKNQDKSICTFKSFSDIGGYDFSEQIRYGFPLRESKLYNMKNF